MNDKRSFLDNLNAGRQRRPGRENAFDDVERTLEQLESRLNKATDRHEPAGAHDDMAQRIQRLSTDLSRHRQQSAPQEQNHQNAPRAFLERAARDLEQTRQRESEVASISGIADELKTLREDLRGLMHNGLNQEFNTLRSELAGIMSALPASSAHGELAGEFERLSDAIAQLAERSDNRGIKILRHEIDEVKSTIATLAREETLNAVDKRWGAFEERISANAPMATDPLINALHARLEEIAHAVDTLPESLSLRSLEERMRTLAAALDQLLTRGNQADPDLYALINERLDEISRAITASAALVQSTNFDPKPFERVEARIASLANQVNELVADRPGDEVVGHLNTLSQRVDDIAQRIQMPEHAVERLASQISAISQKLDTAPDADQADLVLQGFENRFADLTHLIERQQGDTIAHGQSLLDEVERRLQDVSERIDSRANTSGIMATIDARFSELAAQLETRMQAPEDKTAMRALEARLDDISGRLQTSSAQAAGMDPDVIRNLEAQVRSLSDHLSKPSQDVPEFEDIAPRLEKIEQSIHENRAAVLEAARQAAQQAVGALGAAQVDDEETRQLRGELKALEMLARQSDERNSKTFSAIHDTLLKIVDRLGSIESEPETGISSQRKRKIAVEAAPSIEPDEATALLDASQPEDHAAASAALPEPDKRTPAEAAAAAAAAAISESTKETEPRNGKRSLLGGLSRAFSPRQDGTPAIAEREEPGMEDAPQLDTPEIDAQHLNEPLEPGSGAPDLNAIIRRVRDERAVSTRGIEGGADTAKSDFIAAARRAAQAAAAEAEIQKQRQTKMVETSGQSGLGKFLRRSKKPVALTVGALIIAATGMQLGNTFFKQGPDATASIGDVAVPQKLASTPLVQEDNFSAQPQKMTDRPVRILDDNPEAIDASQTAAVTPYTSALASQASGIESAEVAPVENTQAAKPAPTEPGIPETSQPDTASQQQNASLDIPADAGPLALREAAASGDAKALFEIGNRYAQGRGVASSVEKAGEWYAKAAEMGFAPAQYRIGDLYQKGIGVERDAAKAKMWFQLAAQQGNASAMHNLGVLFAMGADGSPDNNSAARWFVEAAERNVKDSQFNLGILSAKGLGVPQSLEEAYKWFALVAMTGDNDATAKRDEVGEVLSPEQLERAKAKAELWKAKALDPEANVVDIPPEWSEDKMTTAGIDMKKAIANIQLILNKNGFEAGPADGVMGAKTKAAIVSFQKQNGMAPTGMVDEKLVHALLKRNQSASATN